MTLAVNQEALLKAMGKLRGKDVFFLEKTQDDTVKVYGNFHDSGLGTMPGNCLSLGIMIKAILFKSFNDAEVEETIHRMHEFEQDEDLDLLGTLLGEAEPGQIVVFGIDENGVPVAQFNESSVPPPSKVQDPLLIGTMLALIFRHGKIFDTDEQYKLFMNAICLPWEDYSDGL